MMIQSMKEMATTWELMVMVTKIATAALSSFWSLSYLSSLKLIGSLDGSKHNPKSSKSKQQNYAQQQNYV
jgi:hypothetical protein